MLKRTGIVSVKLCTCAFIAVLAASLIAQQKKQVTVEWMFGREEVRYCE